MLQSEPDVSIKNQYKGRALEAMLQHSLIPARRQGLSLQVKKPRYLVNNYTCNTPNIFNTTVVSCFSADKLLSPLTHRQVSFSLKFLSVLGSTRACD